MSTATLPTAPIWSAWHSPHCRQLADRAKRFVGESFNMSDFIPSALAQWCARCAADSKHW
jgi:hypothetical protein